MESVERMTQALQVTAAAMQAAREKNPPAELMTMLDDARVRLLRVAKHEADADIESKGVMALPLVIERRHPEALALLEETRREWGQRRTTTERAAEALEAARGQVLEGHQEEALTASTTFDSLIDRLKDQARTAEEIMAEYDQLMSYTRQGAAALGVTI